MPHSSLKNAIPRRTHKERGQLEWRRKQGVGPLEKHKDYQVRSRKRHQREAYVKLLREKALNRNPDEYYIEMAHARKDERGITIIEKVSKEIPKRNKQKQQLRRTSSVNMNLLKLKHSMMLKKIERLKQSLHFIGVKGKNKHTIFVNDEKELDNFDPAVHFGIHPSLAGQTWNRPRQEKLTEFAIKENEHIDSETRKMYEQLERYMEQEKILREAIQDLQMATELAVNNESVEEFERVEGKNNRNLSKELKDVVAVKFKNERQK